VADVAGAKDGGAGRRVCVRLTRSLIGRPERQRRIVYALGLRRVGAVREHRLTPALAGALRKVEHLVAVAECGRGEGVADAGTR
jgi:large subunit ribosomal protein L30